MEHNAKCWANHMGLWAIDGQWFNAAVHAIKVGVWKAEDRHPTVMSVHHDLSAAAGAPAGQPQQGLGIIRLEGPMMRGGSKFGGVNTLEIRQLLREARANQQIGAVLLSVYSPGGSVEGVAELAAEVASTDAVKPVYAYISDLGASAAYWVASQARRVAANASAQVGNIGTYAVLRDTSKAMDMAGIKVHVVSSGGLKGAGADGTEITPDILADMQEKVDAFTAMFVSAVQQGRDMDKKDAAALANGKTWLAGDAKKLNLIDAVQSEDVFIAEILSKMKPKKTGMTRAESQLRIAELE